MRRDMSPGRRGRGMSLRFGNARADNASVTSVWTRARRLARRDERGQAMVEFALIASILLLPLLVGIIQFGVALNFWLDMQKVANQGARWAVVDAYPGCPRTSVPGTDACADPGAFQNFLASERVAKGEDVKPEICFEEKSGSGGTVAQAGDPVTVKMTKPFRFNLIVFTLGTIDLHASATMRTEWAPTVYAEDPTC
jgi:Flp pilus assembly pilin Flp